MKIDLSGKVALVTGASGELGRVMARTLASCGADVAVHCHRQLERAESLGRDITALGRRAFVVQADLTRQTDIQRMRDELLGRNATPDILVNNAVIQYAWASVLEQNEADYESQFRSCVMQNVLMAQAFVPLMIPRGWGRVIGINTECAILNEPGQSAYVSGKRGMDGVLRVLAKEVGMHGITVNQIAPGWTISDKSRGQASPAQTDYETRVPLRRRGTDQEIANVVAFLASDLASFITGAFIPVCGGRALTAI